VAEEVKGLDQPARATLRQYGVRFGAYHIYLPALLKPAPRALATQLWALKNESPDAKGVTELLHLAASGRTSIPVDAETPKPLYRVAGYRICGERAVRVDILERLADLIRPALAWREGVASAKPDGAVDGRSFTVTGAMTSLTGASGEDFASILRALGYRMERRPKPPETPPAEAAVAGETPPAETAAPADAAPAEASAEAAPAEPASPPAEAAPPEPVIDSTALLPEAELMPAPPILEEPAFIEVWRPAGRGEQQRRAHRPRRARAAVTTAPAGDGAAAPAPAEPVGPEHKPRRERDRGRDERKDRGARRDKPRRRREEGPDRAERERYYARPHGGGADRRDKQPDPNSPFAKLAALKAQLEQGDKEQP
jgi:ATP-dependent RNA helicase SUPV3L1/SUV3